MIISIMILGGIMLSASVIGGVLVLHQIRQVQDAASSAKAVFAADTGLEYASWCFFREGCGTGIGSSISSVDCGGAIDVLFDDDSCFTLSSRVAGGAVTVTSYGKSSGARGAERILETVFVQQFEP